MRNVPPNLDKEALEVLRSGLRIVALRSLGDLEAAEEAAQEALVRGLEAIEGGRLAHPENPGSYFRGILSHVISDTFQRQRRLVSLERLPEHVDQNPSNNALNQLISDEQKVAVAALMAELSPQARECLRLCFFEGMPPREIAIRLGEPATRIRKRRSRALKKIREVLEGRKTGAEGHDSASDRTVLGKDHTAEGARIPGGRDD